MDIVRRAFGLAEAVARFAGHARGLYYAVVLLGHACPDCGGRLTMRQEGRCQCVCCGRQLDPTVRFQRCPACGGLPELAVRRYRCRQCGAEVVSRFLFDGLVFDAAYFRQKMVESRQRRRQQRERVRQMLAATRSAPLDGYPADLHAIPGLIEALDGLSAGMAAVSAWRSERPFDLARYQRHVQAHLRDHPVNLMEIPCLEPDGRQDRIWRFIAAVFLAHAGRIAIWQEARDILVCSHEIDREG